MGSPALKRHSDRHGIHIRTVSSWRLLSALLNWFKLVYGPFKSFEQSNMYRTLDFCPDKPENLELDAAQLKSSLLRSYCLIYILTVVTDQLCG
jgi:hypothetical protein